MMGHTVLLVDDEPSVLAALKRALHKEPCTILTAESAEEALDILRSTPIDVVVSDHEMPGMRGTDFLSHVDKLYPDTIRFMLTGHASLEVAIDAINRGAITRFFTKPCNGIDLAISIRQALHHKELMVEAWRLLKKCKQQEAALGRLGYTPGGTGSPKKDDDRIVEVDGELYLDYDQFIDELRRTLGEKDKPADSYEPE